MTLLVGLCLLGSAVLLAFRRRFDAKTRLQLTTQNSGIGDETQTSPIHHTANTDDVLVLELLAVALEAGLPWAQALSVVGKCAQGPAAEAVSKLAHSARQGQVRLPSQDRSQLPHLARAYVLSMRTGAPAAALTREAAVALNRQILMESQVAASKLGVRLVLPLGICALPAFALLAIVPLIAAMASTILRG